MGRSQIRFAKKSELAIHDRTLQFRVNHFLEGPMLRGILVGLDGSAFSDAAVSLGLRWAKAANAILAGQTVIERPDLNAAALPAGSGYFRLAGDDKKLAEARVVADQLLETFAARCTTAGVTGRQLRETGNPASSILLQAQRYDLVLLGLETHFRAMPGGSPCDTVDKVLQSPPRPVVVTPNCLGDGNTAVIGFDGSLQASRTLAAYVSTGLAATYENVVVTIDSDFEEATRTSERAVEYLALHGLAVKPRPVETRLDPASILLDHANQMKAGLVVMGAFGHSPLREFFFGSTTRGVLRDSKVPVMLYH
jgi:nucleotide-binding universal stress UspA family protein